MSLKPSSLKAAVITFPGSNCDDDTVYALSKLVGFDVDRLWHKDTAALEHYKLVVLPGGFSYGDYLRCGAIAANSPIMENVKKFADQGGLVLGICNGFQMLCELGLLPGVLTRNSSHRFICRDVTLRVKSAKTPFTSACKENDLLRLPIAHGDGRYVVDEKDHETMLSNDQIVLAYENNPNGSLFSIAGICNERKNVFGLMPHPERCSDLMSGDGLRIWQSIRKTLEETHAT